MNELLKTILSLSLAGTLLFFALLAFQPLYKNRLSKRWQYYIYLIVIARMLLPFAPETTLMGTVFQHLERPLAGATQAPGGDLPLDLGGTTAPADMPQEPTQTQAMPQLLSRLYENLWVLWAAIACGLLLRKITIYQSFVRFVKAGCGAVADVAILNTLADVGEQIGVKRPVELYTNPLISTPMLLGFFRPTIVLPSLALDNTALVYILGHELTHYRRRDMFYKWLVQILLCLHWFNPFAPLLAKKINQCCELSCDEAMIERMTPAEKKAYGDTLLNSLETTRHCSDKLATMMLTEGAQQLKERLEAIMNYKKASKMMVAPMLAITLALAMGATAIGAYVSPSSAAGAARGPQRQSEESHGNASYTYSQESYYQAPYIFGVGRNLNETWGSYYPAKATVTLADQTTIVVSFDASCAEYAKDEKAMAALKALLEKLVKEYADSPLPLKTPLVSSVKKTGNGDLSQLAAEYYGEDAMTDFVAIFPVLSKSTQNTYCEKMLADGKIAFFAASLSKMDAETINLFAQKAYDYDRTNFFAVTVPYLSQEDKNAWIEKTSREGATRFRAILLQ